MATKRDRYRTKVNKKKKIHINMGRLFAFFFIICIVGYLVYGYIALRDIKSVDILEKSNSNYYLLSERKDQLEKVGFYTAYKYTMRSQDYHLVMKIIGAGMTLYNMQELLYYYTADKGTICRSLNWNRVPGLMWIRWDAYRRNKLPLWCYVYCLKPVITNLIPRFMMKRHYKKVYGK